ncbi:unnamed protein product [Darwinula stevensoni]|uniref:5'-3' exoribonuclease 2 homolog n=1 Tax=Darwinula stevensoni TaxID=69355 RepID=A0A7R9A3U4_9CRUS|nr:unnamed protein product [Darwinula stevensoni]CAG0882051.1 unnamed protein product [Darwinula stevensoni]
MGVPAFFRWLTRKYPSVIVYCVEEKAQQVDGVTIPVDTSKPNPNEIEFDNLYLDMNGIIHPCTHPEDRPAPRDEDEMMRAIFDFIDRIFSIVRPRKLLYMAIDGVAPRAKMNQQRSRRFRASKESWEKQQEVNNIKEELLEKGAHLPEEKNKGFHFDSNCITPGTPFMDRLAKCLHYYIHERLNNDPGWKDIKVILSDANVPGEGEHKIMDFIRKQRAQPDHDPNTHHVLCGADADLIMLGLATHEPNFTIIREEFKPNKPRPCDICSQLGHEMQECQGLPKNRQGEHDELPPPVYAEQKYIYVRLNVLREYLERELNMPNLPFKFDLERAIDDWVFMCFFVGNDFLPHLPSLEIREGAIDRLVSLYKKAVYKTGGYVTNSGLVNMMRVQLIMTDLGQVEDEIFRQRQAREQEYKRREKERKKREKSLSSVAPAFIPGGQFNPVMGRAQMHQSTSNRAVAQELRASMRDNHSESGERGTKRKLEDTERVKEDEDEEPHDEVRLWEEGFKERYYESKFDAPSDDPMFRFRVAQEYAHGLCWVLRYYYQGCPSWKWYYPYHYAPFASDFVELEAIDTEFEENTEPFRPLEQLMGVFPAASRAHVPEPWADLMVNPDSSIIDFYPTDFKIDLNGKKFAWQGVALLPFVNEMRLKLALESFYDLLTDDEKRRNVKGEAVLYVNDSHTGFSFMAGLYEGDSCRDQEREYELNPKLFQGMAGHVLLSPNVVEPGGLLESPVDGLESVKQNHTLCLQYMDLKYPHGFIFPAVRLPDAKDPPRTLKAYGLSHEENRNYRPMLGFNSSRQQAYLNPAGHRFVRGSMGRPDNSPRAPLYRNAPPLMGQVTIPDDQRAAQLIMGAIRHAGGQEVDGKETKSEGSTIRGALAINGEGTRNEVSPIRVTQVVDGRETENNPSFIGVGIQLKEGSRMDIGALLNLEVLPGVDPTQPPVETLLLRGITWLLDLSPSPPPPRLQAPIKDQEQSSSKSRLIRRLCQCCALNGGVFGLSLILWTEVLLPGMERLSPSAASWEFLQPLLHTLFSILWILPLFLLSRLVNCLWFQDIADWTFYHTRGRSSRWSSISQLMADFLFSVVIQTLFLFQSYLVSLLPLAYVAEALYLLHLCFLYSLYAFEYKWFSLGWTLPRRLSFIEINWPYFVGFGLPLALFTSLPASYFLRGCMFSLLFPIFIISGHEATPVLDSSDFPLRLFSPVVALSNAILTTTVETSSSGRRRLASQRDRQQ